MAVAFGTIQTAGVASGSVVITKPTSLAVGDLMLAVLNCEDSGSTFSAAGWTQVATLADSTTRASTVLMKVADASDVAASNFTFTNPGNEALGALMRVTGSSFTDIDNVQVSAVRVSSADETPTFSPGLTTLRNNDLLILAIIAPEILTSFSTYAVANSNPSWTEQADFQNNQTEDASMAIASATYATAGATGDFSAVFTVASQSFGFLLSITEDASASFNADLLTVSTNIIEPTLSSVMTLSADVLGVSVNIIEPTLDTPTPTWTNEDKHAATNVLNQDKS